jgi:hypothetical protein
MWCVQKVSNLWSTERYLLIWRHKTLIAFKEDSFGNAHTSPSASAIVGMMISRAVAFRMLASFD